MRERLIALLWRFRRWLDSVGIEPPLWLLRLGRRLHGALDRPPPPAAPARPDQIAAPATCEAGDLEERLAQIEERLQHIGRVIDRLDTAVYLQSLQRSGER